MYAMLQIYQADQEDVLQSNRHEEIQQTKTPNMDTVPAAEGDAASLETHYP